MSAEGERGGSSSTGRMTAYAQKNWGFPGRCGQHRLETEQRMRRVESGELFLGKRKGSKLTYYSKEARLAILAILAV